MTAHSIKVEDVGAAGSGGGTVGGASSPLAQPGSARRQTSRNSITSQSTTTQTTHTTNSTNSTTRSTGTKRPRPDLQHLSSLTDEEDFNDDDEGDRPQDDHHTNHASPSNSTQPHPVAPAPTRASNRVATRNRRFSASSHGAHSDSSSDSHRTSRSHSNTDTAGSKRRWTPDEDARLVELLQRVPALPWPAISDALPGRSEGSCVSRWQNHLSREVRQSERAAGHKLSGIASAHSHGKLGTTSRRRWTEEEDDELVGWAMHIPALSWDEVAERMEGRSTASCMGEH